jgi:hypothetical protein
MTLLCALTFVAAPTSAQRQATVVMTASSTRVAVGDLFRLQVQVDLTGGDADDVQLPDLSEFEVVRRSVRQPMSMRFGFGQQQPIVRSTRVYSYTLRALRNGHFTIPAVRVVMGSRTVESNSLAVEVSGTGSVQPPPQGQRAPNANDVKPDPWAEVGVAAEGLNGARYDGQAFLQTTVDRADPYVGQQVTVTVYLYTRSPLSSPPAITQQPTADRFWTRDLLPQNRALDAHVQRVAGVPFRVYVLLRFAAFPLEEGPLTIGAPEVDVRAGSLFDVFRAPQALHRIGIPVVVNARALPEGGPDQGGVVGSYRVESSLDRRQVGTGDAVTLNASINGFGNLSDVRLELQAIDGLRVLAPQVEDDIRIDRDRVGGTRRMEWLLVPERPGTYVIPPLGLDVFDPEAGTWRRVEAPALTLIAAGNAIPTRAGDTNDSADLPAGDSDAPEPVHFRPIHPHSELLRAAPPWSASPAFPFALAAPPFLFALMGIGLLLLQRARAKAADDPTKGALREAKKRIDVGRRAAKSGDAKGAYDAASEALLTLLSAKFGESARGLTLRQIQRRLEELEADPDLVRRVVEELESCDFARFSAAGVEADEMAQALKRAHALLVRLARVNTPGAGS